MIFHEDKKTRKREDETIVLLNSKEIFNLNDLTFNKLRIS